MASRDHLHYEPVPSAEFTTVLSDKDPNQGREHANGLHTSGRKDRRCPSDLRRQMLTSVTKGSVTEPIEVERTISAENLNSWLL
jgi:hypothetical protein